MSEVNQQFKELIMKNLSQNGFPMKKVALPLEKLYESADSKGVSLNIILEQLQASGTAHTKEGDKIIFFAQKPKNMSQEDMMAQAQEMMNKMSPEEIQKIQDMVANMTPEQQQDLMYKAKNMGLF